MIARMAVLPITSDNLIRGKTELALKPPLLQALNNIFNGQSDESFNFTEKLLTEDLSVTFDRFLQIVNRVPTVHLRQRSHHSYANQIDLAVFHNLKFLVLEHINLQLLKWKSHLKSQLVSFSGSFCTGIEAVFCDRLAWAELVDLSLTYCKLEPCNNDHYFLNANWIRILNLSYCNLKSCKFLANLHFLEHLNLSFNFLSEIPTLSDMCEIKTLKMNNNCVIQLTGIEKIRSLKYLDLSFNWLPSKYSLIPLEKAENLVTIKLAGCPVSLIKHYRIYVAMCICTKTLPQMVEIDGVPLNKTEQSTLGLNLLKDKMREQTLHPTNVLAENINVPSTSTNVVEEQPVPSNTPGKSKARSKKPFLRVPVIHDESSSSPIEAESPYLEDEPMDDVPRAPTVVPKGPVASVNFTLTQELRAIQEAILRAPTSQASRTPREHGMQTTIIKPTTSNLHLGSITIPSFINCDDDSPLPEIVPETVFAVVHATESEYSRDGLNQEPEPKTSSEDKLKNDGSTGDLKSSRSRVTFVDEGAPEGNLSYDGTEELSKKMEEEFFSALEDRSNLPQNLVQRVKVELVSEFPAASGSESILGDQITVAQDDCKTWEQNSDSGAGSEMKTSSESCEKHVSDDLAVQRVDEKVSAEDCSSPNSEEMIPAKEEDIVGEATIDEKHSDKSSDDESCYESDAEADEFLWQVMRVDPVSKSNQPIFLALLENELKERSPKSGETLTKWPLDIVLSCVKTKNLPITIEMEFETVKKDKQHREYIMEFADAQALTKKIYNILESRPLSAMNEVSLNCLKCNTIFVYKRPSLFGAKERPPFCPVCGSNVVVEVEEPKMPEKSIPLSQSPSQSSIVIGHGAETPGSSQTSSTPKDSRICSARSMEQGHRTETHSNPRKYESDIEVISNPSQSSIEVIDESSRSQSATPMRKKSEERQTVLTTEQNIREMLSPLSALTESSSSGSLTESVITAYESSSVIINKKSVECLPEASCENSPSENSIPIATKEENGNDEKPNSIKDVYSFTDLDMELRVKTFVYHDIFTSENEELCSLIRMIEAVCDLGNEDKIKRWAKARETQSVMMMGTSDPTDREGEEKSEREALDESEGGDDMNREARTPVGAAGGVVPREQRKEKTKLRPRKKAGPGEKLGGTKLLNMENMEEELIFFKQAWDMWGTNPNNIGQRPFVQATDKLGELINNLIRPLMKGYIDLAQEVKYLRGVSSGIGRLSDSLESIDAGVRELQGRDSSARTEYVEESISGNRHIAVAMIKLEEIIREEIGKVVTRVDAVDEKTNKIGGKVDRLIREDITALGRKVDVVSRFVKEGSNPATKVAFAPNTNTAVLASKSNTVGAGSKTKRPRENQEDDSEHENDQWQVVRGRKVPRQKSPPSDMESGRSTAPYSSQFSATDTEGQDSSLTAASGRRRRQTRKQRDRLKRYEGILQKTKELKEKGSPPAILVQKTRPVSLQSEMEITEGAETNDRYKQALMSPPSLKRAVREAVNPVEMQLNVKRVQPLGMDKLKLTVGTEQQAVLLRGELANKGFTVQKDMGPNKPLLMKVHRVDQEIPKENVADKAYDQNAWISECFTREAWKKEFVPSFAKGKREYDNVIWVCAVSARCHIWKTGGSDYDGCFVLSTTAVYFLYSTTMNFSNQSSNWFSLNESYRITDIKRVQPIIWYQGLEIQIKNFSFILILMDGDRTQNLIKDFNGPSLKGIKVFPKPNPKVELSLQQSVLSNDLNHNSEDPSVIHMVMCRSLEITKIEVDEEEILRLAALVLTCGLFIVIPGDLSWLCSGAQPSIVTSRDLSSLIEVERKGMQLVFHFLDEAEAVEELWSLKFGVNTQIDSLLDAIRRPWERRFSVPLEITGL
ncbi:hypothetical protein GE061_002129 [Apolygus lucorum]|uniref:Dynein axonemal assembly factor 1 homolog n=1 Tax=Apolygus lucorum TaxID=248454 RepID=A0A8S9X5M0_APOLU|nr:hypothetical protein GE061_002129 [Apolygus lucorum]